MVSGKWVALNTVSLWRNNMKTIIFAAIGIIFCIAGSAGESQENAKKDISQDDPVKKQIDSALLLMKSKQYDGAKTILENLAKDQGDNLSVLLPLSECYDALKDQPKATETYTKALGIVLEKDGGAYKDTKEGKVVYDKIKKALERLDEAVAMLRKYADMMEKEATSKFKGKNEFAYNKIMEVVKEWKKDGGEKAENDPKKIVVGKWKISIPADNQELYAEISNDFKYAQGNLDTKTIGELTGTAIFTQNKVIVKRSAGKDFIITKFGNVMEGTIDGHKMIWTKLN
jgi:tetratricopeptide (TPR) repeat protein